MAEGKPAGKPKSFASISMTVNEHYFHEEGEREEVLAEGEREEVLAKFERWLAKTLRQARENAG